jgi:protoporphyrin/coproporphyrin ferrochelatase
MMASGAGAPFESSAFASGELPDAVLLIAFGGPESMDEVRPFLQRVLEGRPVPAARFEEVVEHYAEVGGRSPLCEITRRQAVALEQALAASGLPLPVSCGMRNSAPFLRDALATIYERGGRRVLGVIMAAHESPASHDRYRQAIDKALHDLGSRAPAIRYSGGFHDHSGFIAANVEHVAVARARLPESQRDRALLVFTAHSIPTGLAARSPYVEQLKRGAALVAGALGIAEHRLAYQSRSGAPADPWLEPDVNAVIREQAALGRPAIVLCPIGFLCDHVEVLYDLDVEAAKTAREVGIALERSQTPSAHPAFIAALADSVRRACGF